MTVHYNKCQLTGTGKHFNKVFFSTFHQKTENLLALCGTLSKAVHFRRQLAKYRREARTQNGFSQVKTSSSKVLIKNISREHKFR
jgi:hypothetical protein